MTTSPITVPQAMYRFYDAAGTLLYIGVTGDVGVRWRSHNLSKTWWADVARATIAHYPTRTAVLVAEQAAIVAERPVHNVQHNRNRPTVELQVARGATPPPTARSWTFASVRSGWERAVPLWLYWELDGDPITDDYLPTEIDAADLWNLWRRGRLVRDGRQSGPARIWWFVQGPGVLEWAPFQDFSDLDYPPRKDFLTGFTWPADSQTGELLRWSALPVVDKAWRAGSLPAHVQTKGGFIQEATGFKPGPLQPNVDINMLERAARL